MSTPEMIRLPALLAQTGLTLGTIRGFVARGELRALRIGRAVYFDYGEVRRLIDDARRRREPAPPPALRAA
jgi:predicted DNA-binding transcriptional regulator AlpA